MNATSRNTPLHGFVSGTVAETGEDTLRLIALLPAPLGLEDRLQAGLRAAPRAGRVLAWPAALRPGSDWMRSAAAATIVFAVVGGGWGVYTRVQPAPQAKVIQMPARATAPGGFSPAGAVRTPTTFHGPVVTQPAAGQVKILPRTAQKTNQRPQVNVAGQAAAPAAK